MPGASLRRVAHPGRDETPQSCIAARCLRPVVSISTSSRSRVTSFATLVAALRAASWDERLRSFGPIATSATATGWRYSHATSTTEMHRLVLPTASLSRKFNRLSSVEVNDRREWPVHLNGQQVQAVVASSEWCRERDHFELHRVA